MGKFDLAKALHLLVRKSLQILLLNHDSCAFCIFLMYQLNFLVIYIIIVGFNFFKQNRILLLLYCYLFLLYTCVPVLIDLRRIFNVTLIIFYTFVLCFRQLYIFIKRIFYFLIHTCNINILYI